MVGNRARREQAEDARTLAGAPTQHPLNGPCGQRGLSAPVSHRTNLRWPLCVNRLTRLAYRERHRLRDFNLRLTVFITSKTGGALEAAMTLSDKSVSRAQRRPRGASASAA